MLGQQQLANNPQTELGPNCSSV